MRDAYRVVYRAVTNGDLIGARKDFMDHYKKAVQLARDGRYPIAWEFSPGHDKDGRELVILDAAEKGRVSVADAQRILPYHREDEGVNGRLLAIEQRVFKQLTDKNA